MNHKTAAIAAATSGRGISYWNLFNPLSQIMGGGDRYPQFMADIIPDHKTAWMVSKLGAAAILAAAVAGGFRLTEHLNRMSELAEVDDPAKGLKSQIGTTFSVPLSATKDKSKSDINKQAAEESPFKNAVPMPPVVGLAGTMWDNGMRVGMPMAALLLAAAAAWKTVDKYADARRNRILTDAIANKSNTVRKLIEARARNAKGSITDKETNAILSSVADEDNFVKIGSGGISHDKHQDLRRITASLGLLMAALGVAGAVGSYSYFSASNPDNIKYKAMKKGLESYARSKAAITPVTTIPQDAAEYFARIDGTPAAAQEDNLSAVRGEPEKAATNRPISITL